jgi:hypothetical protein
MQGYRPQGHGELAICHCIFEIKESDLRKKLVVAHLWVKDSTGDWLAMALSRGDVMKLTDAGVYPASISQDEMAMKDLGSTLQLVAKGTTLPHLNHCLIHPVG